uniref:Uncharacterized protein n=1 Tax=viral metagenome TaxID=1070528 RepID=A0A6M3IV37_9ZZZZ
MQISKLNKKFPTALTTGSVFADDVNNVYPIETEEEIVKSAKAINDNDFENYSEKEKFLIIDRILVKANELSIADKIKDELSQYIGGDNMYSKEDIDKAVADANEAMKAKHEAEIKKVKDEFEQKRTLSEEEKKFKSEIAEKEKEIEDLKATKEVTEKELSNTKTKNDQLQADVRKRDRVMFLASEFSEVNLDTEAKESKMKKILEITVSFEDDKFQSFAKEEIEFIKKHLVKPAETKANDKEDLVAASTDLPNGEAKADYRTKIENYMSQFK